MRYPFRRPAPDPALEIELTEESFDRWLRAQRPPFEWFLGQPEDVQEALAARGDRYVEDCNERIRAAGSLMRCTGAKEKETLKL